MAGVEEASQCKRQKRNQEDDRHPERFIPDVQPLPTTDKERKEALLITICQKPSASAYRELFDCYSESPGLRDLSEVSTLTLFCDILNECNVDPAESVNARVAACYFAMEGARLRWTEFQSPLMLAFIQTKKIPPSDRKFLHVAWCLLQVVLPPALGLIAAFYLEWADWKGPFPSHKDGLKEVNTYISYHPRFDCFIPSECAMRNHRQTPLGGDIVQPGSPLLTLRVFSSACCHDNQYTYLLRGVDPLTRSLWRKKFGNSHAEHLVDFRARMDPVVCICREGESLIIFHCDNDAFRAASVFSFKTRCFGKDLYFEGGMKTRCVLWADCGKISVCGEAVEGLLIYAREQNERAKGRFGFYVIRDNHLVLLRTFFAWHSAPLTHPYQVAYDRRRRVLYVRAADKQTMEWRFE